MSGVAGKVGALGYKEFDSRDFEGETLEAESESSSTAEAEAKEVEDPGEKGKEETEAAAPADTEVVDDGEKDSEVAEAEGSAEYKANTSYRVYDQERQFPDWAKPLVTSKETEDSFRDLLSKADGLDEMKPRHQQTVQERDQLRSELTFVKDDIKRIVGLRQSNPQVFFTELGIDDDMVIAAAKKIVLAQETPEAWDQYQANRRASVDAYQQSKNAQGMSAQAQQQFMSAHNTALEMALGHPEVKGFEQQFDRLHGLGSFRQQVAAYGNYQYQATRQNVSPMDAVKHVYEFHRKTLPAEAPAGTRAAPAVKPGGTRVAPKALPNVGKGKNASPTQSRPRRLADLRKYVNEHVESGEE